jgi:tripartite-type tricarboxylate transporter receptor subunit TctC
MRRRGSILTIAALAALTSAPAAAQEWPSKPVTLISPAAPGNSPDVNTRILADRLTQLWKQQVIVLNRPGAGGLLAAQAAAGVEKDGYTLYATQASSFNVLPVEQEGKMPVNLQKDFVAVAFVGEQPIAVGVHKDSPAKTVAELIALANKTPEGMFFGATSRGGQAHLTGELFRDRAKANIAFVHASGAAVTLNDVIAGRIPIMFEALAGLNPGIESGDIRVLGVAAAKRLPNMPELPTIAETVPGLVSSGWIILMAPTGTPDAIIQKVNADVRKVTAMPDVIARMQQLGTYGRDLTPAQTDEFIRGEEKLWWPIVRALKEKEK